MGIKYFWDKIEHFQRQFNDTHTHAHESTRMGNSGANRHDVGTKSRTVEQCEHVPEASNESPRISTGGRRRGAQADSLTRRGDTRRRETKSRRDKSPRGEVLTFLRAIGGALDADVAENKILKARRTRKKKEKNRNE